MPDLTERWTQLQDLFEAALDRPPDERSAWLRATCGHDPDLYGEVEALLDGEARQHPIFAPGAVERLAPQALAGALAAGRDGERVGPWVLREQIGEGGMGTVYRAERADGAFEQSVALKLIKPGMDSAAVVARFEAERQILARLQHPGIARLLGGGLAPDGRPFFAMELVRGAPITDYCDARRLGVRARLDLFARVCEAVRYAHQSLVVHRDLKPSNILVASGEAGKGDEGRGMGEAVSGERGGGEAGDKETRAPSPIAHRSSPFSHRASPIAHRPSPAASVKLLDFGIARVLSDDGPEHDLTRTGQRVLTPGTAAPEQVRGEPPTTATDVYALGGLLYRLLCGTPAVATAGRTAREIEQAVLDEAPRRPSDALAPGAADARDTTETALARRLRGDLDTICLTALAKEPERRYGSAADLLSDVQRHLDGLPIAARPATRRYRAGLFLRRHRTGVLATALGAAVLAGVVGFYTTRLAAERDRARTEAATAERVSDFLAGVFEYAIPAENAGRTLSTTELLERGAATLDSALADEPAVQARLMQVVARVYTRLGQFDRAVATGRASVARATAALGAAHPETAHSQAMLARALAERGAPADRAEADSLMGRAVAVLRADPDTDADLLGDVLGEWGWLRQELGHAREAISINEEALDVRTRAHGARSAEAAVAMNNVGYAQYGAGRMAEAERWYRRALDIQRERLGPDNPEVATTLNNLGLALLERGAFDEAREAYAQVLAIDRATLDADHPFIAISLNNHAKTLQALGRYDEAEAAFREALAIRRRSLGARHAMIAQNLNNLGALASDRGDYSEAAGLFTEAVEMSEAIEGAAHPATAIYTLSLVRALRRAGRADEASRRLPAAVERMRTAYRGDAAQLLKTAHEQALVRAARGDVPGGLAHLQRALRTIGARVVAGHPERLAAERSAAALLARAGRCADARSALASVQQRLDDTLPAALRTSLRRPLPACG